MTTGTDAYRHHARAALDAARVVFGAPDLATAGALWAAAQHVLQVVIGRTELTGQALVAEARRLGRLTLSDAHALVALSTWADRSGAPATTESERMMVREAWMALDHAASVAPATPAGFAPNTTHSSRPDDGGTGGHPWAPPPPPAMPAFAGAAEPHPVDDPAEHTFPKNEGVPTRAPSSRQPRRPLVLALLALLVIGGAAWWYAAGRSARSYEQGVAAYQRGARDAARGAFVQAAQLDPDDARPLIYLGRISREDGDLPRARRFLTSAVRLAPASSVAARELASLMLADNQPEIARRFYVRAIELDPTDRTAQGYLGCALFRLQRYDEARRWSERAGPGDWQRCVPPMPLPMGPPLISPPPLPPA